MSCRRVTHTLASTLLEGLSHLESLFAQECMHVRIHKHTLIGACIHTRPLTCPYLLAFPCIPLPFQVLSILSGLCPVQTGQRDCIAGGFAKGKSLAPSLVEHGSRFKLSICVQGGGAQISSQQSSFCIVIAYVFAAIGYLMEILWKWARRYWLHIANFSILLGLLIGSQYTSTDGFWLLLNSRIAVG